MEPLQVCLPVDEYRVLPIPGTNPSGKPYKLATFFVRATDIPADLGNWMAVNPRIPKLNKKEKLSGTVARAITETLVDEPDLFALKNLGIYLLVDRMEHRKETGGNGEVHLTLADPQKHGIVNGGHTFKAIREVLDDPNAAEPTDAWVRMHVIEGLVPNLITEIAEGLNRSLQVTDQALANLQGEFNEIKAALEGHTGANMISYTTGQAGEVDIQEILSIMALINMKEYPEGTYPNGVFGQPKSVLAQFKTDVDPKNSNSGFKRMYPRLHEILVLWDRVQEEAAKWDPPGLGALGRKKGKQNQRKNPRPAIFSGRTIDRNVFAGLIYPIIAAFRANISQKAWEEGQFEWLVDPELLLSESFAEMATVVKQEYNDNKSKPAEVGKKEAAYRGCYGVLLMKLARMGKLN